MELFNNELTNEEYDFLMCEQSKGKELKVINGKVIAVTHIETAEEIKNKRVSEIKERLAILSEDFIQASIGANFEDLNIRINEFRTLHNELRALQGKAPRVYKDVI